MKSSEYRTNIRVMIRKATMRKFPGLKPLHVKELATELSVAIHARFYGADVDGVASPIWRDDAKYADMFKDRQATKTAQELLDDA
jgi:hypothetical protein